MRDVLLKSIPGIFAGNSFSYTFTCSPAEWPSTSFDDQFALPIGLLQILDDLLLIMATIKQVTSFEVRNAVQCYVSPHSLPSFIRRLNTQE